MPSQYTVNGVVRTITTATATLTDYEAGGVVVVNRAAGSTITLPAATGAGYRYEIVNAVTQTGDLVIEVPDASHTFVGKANLIDADFAAASDSDTITLNGTTTGGIAGSVVRLTDIASNKWAVEIEGVSSGTEATPFSAAVS